MKGNISEKISCQVSNRRSQISERKNNELSSTSTVIKVVQISRTNSFFFCFLIERKEIKKRQIHKLDSSLSTKKKMTVLSPMVLTDVTYLSLVNHRRLPAEGRGRTHHCRPRHQHKAQHPCGGPALSPPPWAEEPCPHCLHYHGCNRGELLALN